MQRRQFLAASAAAAVGVLAAGRSVRAADEKSGRQYFEIRRYHFASAEKQKAYEQFLTEAGVPAYNRAGVEPVGVFKILAKDNPNLKLEKDSTDLYVFLPHNTFESVITLENRLDADKEFQSSGQKILNAPKSDPAYTRYESTLLLAMERAPRLERPATKSPDRVLELRTYESRTNQRHLNKLEMFNAGEFDAFKKANMPGIFYGGAIVGEKMPQLTYMVVHESREAAVANWKAFGAVPEWRTLSRDPKYQDNVTKITDEYVRPSPASQL
jgi:hypothetical protein